MNNAMIMLKYRENSRPASSGVLQSALRMYMSMLCALIVVVCFLDLANYLNLINRAVLPKFIYAFMVLAAAPVMLYKWKSMLRYLGTVPIIWLLLFGFLDLLHWFAYTSYGNVEAAELTLTRVQFLLLAIIFGFVLTRSTPRLLSRYFFGTAICLSLLQVIDFTMPGFLIPADTIGVIPGRAASTLLNANKAAESLVLLYIFGAAGMRKAHRLWLLLAIACGVLLTFSRSGMLAVLAILFYGYFYGLIERRTTLVVGVTMVSLVMVAGGLLIDDLLRFVDFEAIQNVYNRLLFLSNLDVGDASSGERFAVAEHAFAVFLQQPIFGNGSGYTAFWDFSTQGPHNQQLLILAEYGMIGYLMFLWLVLLMFRGGDFFQALSAQRFHAISVFVFLIFTLFTHNMFDFLYWLLAIVLISHRGFDVYRR